MISDLGFRTSNWMLRRTLLAAVFAIAWSSSAALAQDDEVVENVPEAVPEQQFIVAEEQFDQWVFGAGRAVGPVRARFESMLKVQVEGVERNCPLSEEQKHKLMLAGRVDIRRFFARVDQLKKKFDLVKHDQNKFNEFWQEAQPLQAIVNKGTFGEGSYFRKTLNNLLTADQVVKVETADRERRRYQYRSKVETVVCSLDEVLSLRAEQRRKLIDLLTTETQIPRTFGQDSYSQYAVLYRASRLPDDRLHELFDKPQMAAFQRVLNHTRGFEQFLKVNGFAWDESAPAGGRAGAKVEAKVEFQGAGP